MYLHRHIPNQVYPPVSSLLPSFILFSFYLFFMLLTMLLLTRLLFIVMAFAVGLIGDLFVLLTWLFTCGLCCNSKYHRKKCCVTKYRYSPPPLPLPFPLSLSFPLPPPSPSPPSLSLSLPPSLPPFSSVFPFSFYVSILIFCFSNKSKDQCNENWCDVCEACGDC